MKNRTKLMLSLAILIFVSCKSAEFKAQRNIAKSEIFEVFKKLTKENETKLSLTSQVLKIVSSLNFDNTKTVHLVNRNGMELSELNTDFAHKRLTKRAITNYFQKQNELSINLNKLFQEIDNSSEISRSQNYGDLINAIERNKNKIKKLVEQYNRILNINSDYVSYPKFNMSGI